MNWGKFSTADIVLNTAVNHVLEKVLQAQKYFLLRDSWVYTYRPRVHYRMVPYWLLVGTVIIVDAEIGKKNFQYPCYMMH